MIFRQITWLSVKSRDFQTNHAWLSDKSCDFQTNHVTFRQIPWRSDKSRDFQTNHVTFRQIPWRSDKSRDFQTNHVTFRQITLLSDKSRYFQTYHVTFRIITWLSSSQSKMRDGDLRKCTFFEVAENEDQNRCALVPLKKLAIICTAPRQWRSQKHQLKCKCTLNRQKSPCSHDQDNFLLYCAYCGSELILQIISPENRIQCLGQELKY